MSTPRRFTKSHPCPVCGGHDGLGRGQGVRCFGYLDRSGDYARCTREEHAGSLPQNRDGTYSHRLHGQCRCGQAHGDAPARRGPPRRREHPPPAGRAAVPLVFHAGGLPPPPLRRGHGHPPLDLPRRRRATRSSASSASITGHRTARTAKSYRPCHRAADGRWLLSRPDMPLPLYNLPAILAAPPEAIIAVLEGEKCTDIAAAPRPALRHDQCPRGQGAAAHRLVAAGRAIRRHPPRRGRTTARATPPRSPPCWPPSIPPARVQIVSLPGLSDGEDIEQFIAARRSAGRTDAEILAELRALIAPSR